jgi:hypothetical protein
MSFYVHNITSSDVDLAVRYNPSTDRNAWHRGAQTIEDYFSPGGIFWAEPITPDGEYIADQSINMNVSGDAGNGAGLNIGGKIDSDIENDSAIGIATGTDANNGVHIKSDNINDSDIDNSNSTAMDISTSTDLNSTRRPRSRRTALLPPTAHRQPQRRRVPSLRSALRKSVAAPLAPAQEQTL